MRPRVLKQYSHRKLRLNWFLSRPTAPCPTPGNSNQPAGILGSQNLLKNARKKLGRFAIGAHWDFAAGARAVLGSQRVRVAKSARNGFDRRPRFAAAASRERLALRSL